MMGAASNLEQSRMPTLVAGLGLTGWSVVRYLIAQGGEVVVTDTRENPPYLDSLKETFPDIQFIQNLPDNEYDTYGVVVASPGLAVEAENVIGDIELFVQVAQAPIIAITGSNGKSTVTMLVSNMLDAGSYKVEVGGNIGTPALDLLQHPVPDFYVLELSSFQLETTHSLAAKSSVVLNVSEDHMDRYSTLPDYIDAKFRIYNNAERQVLNRDDPVVGQFSHDRNMVSFGLDQPEPGQLGIIEEKNQRFFALGVDKISAVSEMTLQGEQNVSNILAAMALVTAAGLPLTPEMVGAAMAYRGLPYRCELVGIWGDIKWINDSKGTNVGATLAAIYGADKPLLLIAGGQGKDADFSPIADALDQGTKKILLFGEDAAIIACALGKGDRVKIVDSLQQAVVCAKNSAAPGDTVLFSPACASFDMFRSYVHRGEVFTQLVKEANHAG